MTKSITRGRPSDPGKQEQQRGKLLTSAQQLLTKKSYRDISIRELASHAGVNSAMISYYFESKEGLFLALLKQISENHFSKMQAIAKSDDPIKAFIFFILNMLSKNSGFARFVYDEFGQNRSQLGDTFMQLFPKRMANILPRLIVKHTAIRNMKQAKYAAFNLMSMIIMPFVGRSVRLQAWEIGDEIIFSKDWAEHIYQQFIFGCNAKQKI